MRFPGIGNPQYFFSGVLKCNDINFRVNTLICSKVIAEFNHLLNSNQWRQLPSFTHVTSVTQNITYPSLHTKSLTSKIELWFFFRYIWRRYPYLKCTWPWKLIHFPFLNCFSWLISHPAKNLNPNALDELMTLNECKFFIGLNDRLEKKVDYNCYKHFLVWYL